MTLEAGTVIDGPDGQGYTVTQTLRPGDVITRDSFKPFGGAPDPKEIDFIQMPDWLLKYLRGEKPNGS